jgi:disulfide bond formation protein DsbB
VRVYQFRHTGKRCHLYIQPTPAAKRKSLAHGGLRSGTGQKAQKAALIAWTAFLFVLMILSTAALRAALDNNANANNQHPSDQGRHPISLNRIDSGLRACFRLKDRPIAAGCEGAAGEGVMAQTSALRMTRALRMIRLDRLRGEPAAAAALAIFVLSSATIVGAWYFEFVLKLPPCPLCLEERLPYHVVIPLSLLMAIAALARAPRTLLAVGFTAIMVAMLCGAALGTYHAGVEWHLWAGPTDCSGPITDLNAKGSILGQLNSIHVVRCDEAAWRFLGISLAGYNVLISLALAAIAGYGLLASRRAA